QAGGRDEMRKRLDDVDQHVRLVTEMETNLRRRGGAASLLITNARNQELVGKRLDALATQGHQSPIDAALNIIRTEGAVSLASFNMSEKDIENFMKQKFVMTGSDGSAGHPRKYGTFSKKLREYVYQKKIISLPFAVHQSSALTAETFRISQRGRLQVGFF